MGAGDHGAAGGGRLDRRARERVGRGGGDRDEIRGPEHRLDVVAEADQPEPPIDAEAAGELEQAARSPLGPRPRLAGEHPDRTTFVQRRLGERANEHVLSLPIGDSPEHRDHRLLEIEPERAARVAARSPVRLPRQSVVEHLDRVGGPELGGRGVRDARQRGGGREQRPVAGPQPPEPRVDLAHVPHVRNPPGAAAAAPPSTTEVFEWTSATRRRRTSAPSVAASRASAAAIDATPAAVACSRRSTLRAAYVHLNAGGAQVVGERPADGSTTSGR